MAASRTNIVNFANGRAIGLGLGVLDFILGAFASGDSPAPFPFPAPIALNFILGCWLKKRGKIDLGKSMIIGGSVFSAGL